jgi:hypothetical protein
MFRSEDESPKITRGFLMTGEYRGVSVARELLLITSTQGKIFALQVIFPPNSGCDPITQMESAGHSPGAF